jgi:hypothetical protein
LAVLASAVLIVAIVVAAVGCDAGSLAAGSTDTTDAAGGSLAMASQEKPAAIDVGVVLADRAGYFCLPIEQLGFSAADALVSTKSSCECIEPRLVEYVGGDGAPKPAILLEYVDESAGSGGKFDPQPMNLGVIITVETASGTTHDFTVNLLHTVLAAAEESSEVLQ